MKKKIFYKNGLKFGFQMIVINLNNYALSIQAPTVFLPCLGFGTPKSESESE